MLANMMQLVNATKLYKAYKQLQNDLYDLQVCWAALQLAIS